MSDKSKTFLLGEVLTITTGVLLCPMGGVYKILNWMTRDDLFTHQLPRASNECKPWLLRQHPHLADVDASDVTPENVKEWLARQIGLYGQELVVYRIPMDDHDVKDPIAELSEMMDKQEDKTADAE